MGTGWPSSLSSGCPARRKRSRACRESSCPCGTGAQAWPWGCSLSRRRVLARRTHRPRPSEGSEEGCNLARFRGGGRRNEARYTRGRRAMGGACLTACTYEYRHYWTRLQFFSQDKRTGYSCTVSQKTCNSSSMILLFGAKHLFMNVYKAWSSDSIHRCKERR